MLQVAFGQSKYYSDNLSENVKRGIRQKIRRGEWPTRAPFGYVNNPKTRNIEPEPLKSKIVKKMFQEFAEEKHSFESMRNRLALWGITSRNGSPVSKSNVQHILTNKAYIGFIVNNGETYPGKFPALISQSTFNKVQQLLKKRARPDRTRKNYHFPFTKLFKCGECGGAITAQFAHGNGGTYRYYRCTKKYSKCSQPYLRENVFAEQLKSYFQQIALLDDWAENMLHQIEIWKDDKENSTIKIVENLENKILEIKNKLDKLVDAFLDGTIDKEIYLVKKDELIQKKAILLEKKHSFKHGGKSWVEPLMEFVKAAHRAEKLAKSNDFDKIKSFAEKIGTNHHLLDRKLLFDFKKPFDLIPHFIFSEKNKSCNTIKNIRSISQQSAPDLSSTIDKNCRLKSPIITGIDKISTFSVGGKIPPDFLSKNRLNRHGMSIAINKKRQKKSPEKSFQGLNSISSVFVENSENKKWWAQ